MGKHWVRNLLYALFLLCFLFLVYNFFTHTTSMLQLIAGSALLGYFAFFVRQQSVPRLQVDYQRGSALVSWTCPECGNINTLYDAHNSPAYQAHPDLPTEVALINTFATHDYKHRRRCTSCNTRVLVESFSVKLVMKSGTYA